MVTLEKHENSFVVYRDQRSIGTVALHGNPYHMRNCYLKLDLSSYPHEISKDLFSQIAREVQKRLQIMLPSDEQEQIAFLQTGGFSCKRKCYEVEATSSDLIAVFPGGSSCHLFSCVRGNIEYAKCCKLMYDTYIQNHALINPWTAGFETFCKRLPDHVICAEENREIFGIAFVEESEIAYIYGKEPHRFPCFAMGLVAQMFEHYETICFESDDCDWAAMMLKSLFANQSDESYNTYIWGDNL